MKTSSTETEVLKDNIAPTVVAPRLILPIPQLQVVDVIHFVIPLEPFAQTTNVLYLAHSPPTLS